MFLVTPKQVPGREKGGQGRVYIQEKGSLTAMARRIDNVRLAKV